MNEALFLLHLLALYLLSVTIFHKKHHWHIVWLCIMPVLANLTIAKQIMLFGFEVTTADVYSVAYFVGMNSYHERYGLKSAYKLVRLSLSITVIVPILLCVHTVYIPSTHDEYQSVFVKLFTLVPWISLVSFGSFAISQFFERRLFAYFATRRSFVYETRSFLSASISQVLDTALFTYIALGGLVHKPMDVFIVSYSIKLLILSIWCCISLLHKNKVEAYVRHKNI
tara:strand:+ start:1131 stop:1808 length:678 start_codon:yes stop_codon:yes gene_type:complete